MFQRPERQHPNLPSGYKLQGGNELVFQSFGLIQLSYKEKLDERNPVYGDNINGFIALIKFVKNKSTVSGIPFRVVFDKRLGYIPELSDWEYLFTTKYGFSGSPVSYKLDILPEVNFSRKSLFDKCKNNLLLSRALNFTARYKMISDIHLPDMSIRPLSKLCDNMSFNERIALINCFSSNYPFSKIEYNIEDIQSINAGNLYIVQNLLGSKTPMLTPYDYDLETHYNKKYLFGKTKLYTPFDF